jgi:hypothetical protein
MSLRRPGFLWTSGIAAAATEQGRAPVLVLLESLVVSLGSLARWLHHLCLCKGKVLPKQSTQCLSCTHMA